MFYVYILKSQNVNKFYVGQTDNLDRRLEEHNLGYSSHTKKYVPWGIVYKEEYQTRKDAVEREKYFKSSAGRRWLKKNAQVAKLVDALP